MISHFFKTILIFILRSLARFKPLGSRIFDRLEDIDMDAEQRERVYSYIFRKVELRHYLKRRRYRERLRAQIERANAKRNRTTDKMRARAQRLEEKRALADVKRARTYEKMRERAARVEEKRAREDARRAQKYAAMAESERQAQRRAENQKRRNRRLQKRAKAKQYNPPDVFAKISETRRAHTRRVKAERAAQDAKYARKMEKRHKRAERKENKRDERIALKGYDRAFSGAFRLPPLTFKQVVTSVLVACLKGLERIGLGRISTFLLRRIAQTNLDQTQIQSLYMRVFGDESAARMALESRTYFADDIKAGRSRNWPQTAAAMNQLKVLNIFLEPGGFLPKWMTSPDIKAVRFRIYAFADVTDQIARAGLSDRAEQSSLRDRFNDISDEGEALFRDATTFSERIVASLLANLPISDLPVKENESRLRESLVNGLDTLLSSRMSLLRCYANAIADVPKNEAVIFCAASPDYIIPGWGVLSSGRRADRFAVSHAAPTRAAAEDFASELYLTVSRAQGEEDHDEDDMTAKAVLPETFMSRWTAFLNVSAGGVTAYGGNIARRLGSGTTAIIIHAESAKPYQQTLRVLSEALQGRTDPANRPVFTNTVYLHCALQREINILPQVLGRRGSAADDNAIELALDMGGLEGLLRRYVTNAYDVEAAAHGILDVSGPFLQDGIDMKDLIAIPLERYLRRNLPWIVMAYRLGRSLSRDVNPDIAFASTSRNWMSRAVCAGLLDGEDVSASDAQGEPVIASGLTGLVDVQTMNILNHPKYKAPMATHLCLIDNQAQDIHLRAYDFPPEAIRLVGAPPNDLLARAVQAVDKGAVRTGLAISAQARIVTLISQLQPMERMLKIAAPLATFMATENAVVVVRLHPREGEGRRNAYQAYFDAQGLGDRIRFSRAEQPAEILAVSDVCVTIYSNMAREAALIGVPVISVEFLNWTPPISLSAEGLAAPADTPEHMVARLRTVLATDRADQGRNGYLEANPHMLSGPAGAHIVDFARELVGESTGREALIFSSGSKFSDHPALDGLSSGHLVCADDVKLQSVPAIFSPFADLAVFTSDMSGNHGFLPGTAQVNTTAYGAGEDDALKWAVDHANSVTHMVVDALIDWAEPMGALRDTLGRLRQTLWLQMRPTAIRVARALSVRNRGIETAEGKAVILHSGDPAVLRKMVDQAVARHGDAAPVFALRTSYDLSYEVISAADYLQEDRTPSIAAQAMNPSASFIRKSSAAMTRWWTGIVETPLKRVSGPRILITTDWRLKTVPPTLIPVINAQRKRGTRVEIANIADRDLDQIAADLAVPELRKDTLEISCPSRIASQYSVPPGRVMKRLSQYAGYTLAQRSDVQALDPEMQIMVGRMTYAFVRTRLVETILWDRHCTQFTAQRSAASVACPGRQWHAQAAHDAAEAQGRLSMTMQNSYMTAGYTYTKPTGQYLTAIDRWSRDLFVNDFALDPASVHITSTPRFDYLAGLESLSQSEARRDVGLRDDEAVVLFAAQDRYENDALMIIAELARLGEVDGKPVRVIAKLHPRTSPEDIRKYRAAADAVSPHHHVSIVSDTKIATYLAACDVAITMFSNVGTEAAVLGKNLIIVNLTGESLPLPMDEFDIGHVVTDRNDLAPSVERYFTDAAFMQVQADRVTRFRNGNPHMVKGSSTRTLSQVITKAIG